MCQITLNEVCFFHFFFVFFFFQENEVEILKTEIDKTRSAMKNMIRRKKSRESDADEKRFEGLKRTNSYLLPYKSRHTLNNIQSATPTHIVTQLSIYNLCLVVASTFFSYKLGQFMHA